jgi:hypothetical protein
MWRRVVLLVCCFNWAHAAPPSDSVRDPALEQWFRSLERPGSHVSCCSVADCRRVGYRVSDGHHEVRVNGQWYIVPSDAIIRRENPTGDAIACYRSADYGLGAIPVPPYVDSLEAGAGLVIRCFVPPPGV